MYDINKKNDKCQSNCFQKLNVKLTLQIFGHSVVSAIKTCFSALPTAKFIELLDKVFDVLNSRFLFDNFFFKSALTDKNLQVFKGKKNISHLFKIHKKLLNPLIFKD